LSYNGSILCPFELHPKEEGREEGGAAEDDPLFVYLSGSAAEGNINFE